MPFSVSQAANVALSVLKITDVHIPFHELTKGKTITIINLKIANECEQKMNLLLNKETHTHLSLGRASDAKKLTRSGTPAQAANLVTFGWFNLPERL